MYAPVVFRFHTYAVEVGAAARAYMDAVMALPAWHEWRTAALAELGAARGRGGLAEGSARMTPAAEQARGYAPRLRHRGRKNVEVVY